jgi:hypothetical protein
LNPKSHEA